MMNRNWMLVLAALAVVACDRSSSPPLTDGGSGDGAADAVAVDGVMDLRAGDLGDEMDGTGEGVDLATSCAQGASQSCTTPYPGVCADGTQDCTPAGVWGPCQATVKPGDSQESCGNSFDDDCDGMIDAQDTDCQECPPSSTTQSCTTAYKGVCSAGTHDCTLQEGGSVWKWGPCVATIQPGSQTEVCIGAQDEDCDGQTDSADPDCQSCTPSVTQSCTTSYPGVCSVGSHTCTLNSATGIWDWDPCVATIQPGSQAEVCSNSKDDDCDGATDSADSDCCSNQCTSGTTCIGNAVYSCGNCDADACLDWCLSQNCGSGYTCSGGSCQALYTWGWRLANATCTNGYPVGSPCTAAQFGTWACCNDGWNCHCDDYQGHVDWWGLPLPW